MRAKLPLLTPKAMELSAWVANVNTKSAKRLTDGHVSNAYVKAFDWLPGNESLIVSSVKKDRGSAPQKPLAPVGPVIQEATDAEPLQNLSGLIEKSIR